jgi:predicted alpha/beta hydrolase
VSGNHSGRTTVPARDGFPLAATVCRADPASRRVVIVSSATAVPRGFYRHYARALADAGFVAVTYDYRGIGDSRPASLRGFVAKTRDWGLLDMAGVVDWVAARFEAEQIFMVGHSVGGQLAGLLDNSDLIDGMLALSAQSGYWRLQGGEQKLAVAFHVHVSLPVLANALGYMPWSWFGPAEDLPKDAALQWSRWCRHPLYVLGDDTLPLERYTGFRAPVLAYSIEDDKWGTRRAVDAMMSAYPNVERRHLEPGDYGPGSLGHFGYFRPGAKRLWSDGHAWLNALAPGGADG